MNTDKRGFLKRTLISFIRVDQCSSVVNKRARYAAPATLMIISVLLLSLPAHAFFLVGHRGARYIEDENTIEAMELALERGADALEFDVRLTADHVPVIMHDSSVSRTTDGKGRVREMTATEFASLKTERGHSPPTLEQVLENFGDRGITLFVEIKQNDEALWPPLAALLNRYRGSSQVVVFGIDAGFLARFKRAAPEVLAFYAPVNPFTALEEVLRFDLDGLLLADFFTTRSMVEKAHARGLPVVTSMLARQWEIDRAMRAGVDGVLVNDPAMVDLRP